MDLLFGVDAEFSREAIRRLGGGGVEFKTPARRLLDQIAQGLRVPARGEARKRRCKRVILIGAGCGRIDRLVEEALRVGLFDNAKTRRRARLNGKPLKDVLAE